MSEEILTADEIEWLTPDEDPRATHVILWDEAAEPTGEEIVLEDGDTEPVYDGPIAYWELEGEDEKQ